MKKLMIAVAAAAMIGGVQAVTCIDGKVCTKDPCTGEKTCYEICGAGSAYKVAISLKTTALKGKKSKAKCSDDCFYWREQTTKKIDGLIWEQLEDCEGCYVFDGAKSAFWTKEGALDLEFGIGVGVIGKGETSKKAEAYGVLSGDDFGVLSWAGFGSWASTTKKNQCADDDCLMYLKSISGGIAGQCIVPDWEDVCLDCDPIVYEGCCGDMQLENTAAYGTIKISYDKSTAKKVAAALDPEDINEFYKLPAAAALDYLDGTVTPGDVVIEE